ncbi:MAG: hypothetical protein HYS25_15270 [Ignavibacteriales bacterium]|nr:hypothetical protein [Ignavibacteriales bacterium]
MIEIRITTEAALSMLLERMKFELRQRQRAGLMMKELRLEDLSYKELFSVVEASVFDTIFLMPVELITHQTNLTSIITDTVRSLARIYKREEFALFTNKRAVKLIEPIVKYFARIGGAKDFQNN